MRIAAPIDRCPPSRGEKLKKNHPMIRSKRACVVGGLTGPLETGGLSLNRPQSDASGRRAASACYSSRKGQVKGGARAGEKEPPRVE